MIGLLETAEERIDRLEIGRAAAPGPGPFDHVLIPNSSASSTSSRKGAAGEIHGLRRTRDTLIESELRAGWPIDDARRHADAAISEHHFSVYQGRETR
jgi:hypothetical protein